MDSSPRPEGHRPSALSKRGLYRTDILPARSVMERHIAPSRRCLRAHRRAWLGQWTFELAFSDETGTRSVTRTRDYVYPQDARYEPATNMLWLVVEGRGGDVFPEARLHKYDLNSRTVLGEWDVSPDDVSSECSVSESQPIVAR